MPIKSLKSLKSKITQLKEKYTSPPSTVGMLSNLLFDNHKSLQERLAIVHYQIVLTELDTIMRNHSSNSDELFTALEQFLKTTWSKIAGSCFSYTALPRHEITELMCDIAEWLAEENKASLLRQGSTFHFISDIPDDWSLYRSSYVFREKTQMVTKLVQERDPITCELLTKPQLRPVFEPTRDGYGVAITDAGGQPILQEKVDEHGDPVMEPVLDHNQQPIRQPILKQRRVEETRRELYYIDDDGHEELVPITSMDQFKLNIDPIKPRDTSETRLSSTQITEFITENGGHKPPDRLAIGFLMPGIVTSTARTPVHIPANEATHTPAIDDDGYPNLSEIPNLQQIISTHILGDDHKHLIPVQLMTELDLKARSDKIRKPYVANREDGHAYTLAIEAGCDIYFMPSLPTDLSQYADNYLLINDSTLVYVDQDGTSASAPIGDWNLFKDVISQLYTERSVSVHLSVNHIHDLIPRNSDIQHTTGCDLHWMQTLPDDLENYVGSYLLINVNSLIENERKLIYIQEDGTPKELNVNHWDIFKSRLIHAMHTGLLTQFHLQLDHIKNLITANGGHSILRYSNEYKRLREHSPLTQAIIAAQEAHKELLNSQNQNLYTELKRLCDDLEKNMAGGSGGNTDHHFAGKGAYGAIIRFASFYHTLGYELCVTSPALDIDRVYDLALMSSDAPSPNTIYIDIEPNSQGLKYQLIDLHGNIKSDTIKFENLPPDFPRNPEQIIAEKGKYLPTILEKTSNAGHTPNKENAESGIIYLSENGNYIIRGPNGTVNTGHVEGIDLNNLNSKIDDPNLVVSIVASTEAAGHSLPLAQQKKHLVPRRLRDGINFLLTLSSNPAANKNTSNTGADNIATCIALRRGDIESRMENHSALLATITGRTDAETASEAEKKRFTKLVDEASKKFVKTQKNLKKSLTKNTYDNGQDLLSMDDALLAQYPIESILSVQPPITNVDTLLAFIKKLSNKDRGLLFRALDEYWLTIVPNILELKKLLEARPSEQAIILETIGPFVHSMIEAIDDFILLEPYLPRNHRLFVFNKLKPNLERLITKSGQFKAIRKYLTNSEQKTFINGLEHRLPGVWLELKHEKFISRIKLDVLSKVIPQLRQTWLMHKEQEIAREIASMRRFDLPGSWFSPGEEERREAYYVNYRNSRLDGYENQLPELEKKWNTAFSQQIDDVSPGSIMHQLFQQHAWIERDRESILVEQHLSKTLKTHLLKGLIRKTATGDDIIPSCAERFQISEELLDRPLNENNTSRLQWEALDMPWLQAYTQGFPLQQVNPFYLDNKLLNYPNLNNLPSNSRLDIFLNWQPTRIDVLRLLARQHSAFMHAETIEPNLVCPKIIPIEYHELANLTDSQLQHVNQLVINIGTEDNTRWIILYKNGDSWTGYFPPGSNVEEIKDQLGTRLPINLCVSEYNSDLNDQLNDIENIPALTHWHTLLFSRILPSCVDNLAFNLLRDTVPLPILLQTTLLNTLPNSSPLENAIALKMNVRYPLNIPSLIPESNFAIQTLSQNNRLAHKILSYFDNQEWVIEDEGKTLRINTNSVNPTEIAAAFEILTYCSITKLIFTPDGAKDNAAYDLSNLFNYNTTLKSIVPIHEYPNTMIFSEASRHAARNRLLAFKNPEILEQASANPHERNRLWLEAGQIIMHALQTDASQPNLSFMNELHEFTQLWRESHCLDHYPQPSDTIWELAQFAELGTAGLDNLFAQLNSHFVIPWNAELQKPAPLLDGLFDLAGAAAENNPSSYVNQLTSKISEFDKEESGCAPLFKSLSFIFPDDDKHNFIEEFIKLLKALCERHVLHPEEPAEFFLYNISYDDPHIYTLFDQLEKLSLEADFDLLIRIPDWDQNSAHEDNKSLKYKYRGLQNKILNNQRKERAISLPERSKRIEAMQTGKLNPEIIITPKEAHLKQQFIGEEIWYPLSTEIPGIQQQQQQQREQEQEQEQQQQQQQEQRHKATVEIVADPDPIIRPYLKSKDLLIRRSTIDTHTQCKAYWRATDPSTKNLSGIDHDSLSELFSLWVGSNSDADEVIETMEISAVEKLMRYASYFRSGINKDNLPAGFYLARADNDPGLILCFDEDQEKRDLIARAALDPRKRNPFTLQLRDPRPAVTHQGDYRQLTPFFENEQLLWHCLAGKDPERADDVAPENYFESGLDALKQWAQKEGTSQELLDALFDANSATSLTKENLKAFGQLANYYNSIQTNPNATEIKYDACITWLTIAKEMYKTFGPKKHAQGKPTEAFNGFQIWKENFLDKSVNWSEYLDEEEVSAFSSSIVTLKSKTLEQRIWWRLVAAQGKATEHLRYAELWNAYLALIKHVEAQHLVLNEQSLERLLTANPNYNVIVLLDRLTSVLQRTSNELQGELIGQKIVTHLDAIDWRHNGLYYSVRYEKYPYWDIDLGLTEFTQSTTEDTTSYVPKWPTDKANIKNLVLHTLRFLSVRGRISFVEFESIKPHVLRAAGAVKKPEPLLRLLSACLSIGLDKATDIKTESFIAQYQALDKSDPKLLNWISQQLNLDEGLTPNTLELRWQDIAVLIDSIVAASPRMKNAILSLKNPQSLEFINACGRALRCFAPNPQQKMHLLLTKVEESKNLFPAILTDYPWLIDNDYREETDPVALENAITSSKQWKIFQQQLHSIAYEESTYFPSMTELQQANKDILYQDNPESARRNIVDDWVGRGCQITFQEARFRPLLRHELARTLSYLDRALELNFKNNNLPLCKLFAERYLALETDGSPREELNKLLETLASIDNKPHFNELGQVIGLLVTQAKGPPARRYAAAQLTTWLNALIDENTYKTRHYPSNLLQELCKSDASLSLLNNRLDDLRAEIPEPILLNLTQQIIAAKLPNRYNEILMYLALRKPAKFKTTLEILSRLYKQGIESNYLEALGKYFLQESPTDLENAFTQHSEDIPGFDVTLQSLWQLCQTKLIERWMRGLLNSQATPMTSEKDAYIHMIWILSSKDNEAINNDLLTNVKTALAGWPISELRALAHYYASDPRPSILQLNLLLNDEPHKDRNPRFWQSIALTKPRQDKEDAFWNSLPLEASDLPPKASIPNKKTAQDLIHHFESVLQAYTDDEKPKRQYEFSDKENKRLVSIIQGIKRKDHGPLSQQEQNKLLHLLFLSNSFAQADQLSTQTTDQLVSGLHNYVRELKKHANSPDQKHQDTACLLAIMREILLRKTGKWANHTQMLDLLYAAIHNDESLLHQVRTGEGKSIITVMRTAYLALNGCIVDVFSAKESLSQRDALEFSPVLEAMGIRTSYITAGSEASTYHDKLDKNGIGAVNYATLGNFSLFLANHVWNGKDKIELDRAKRVAFLDEADQALNNDQTLFNFSDNRHNQGIYNYDEWVYRATYDFFLLHKEDIYSRVDENGSVLVSNHKHLQALCDFIQARSINKPAQSTFMEEFIIPALDDELKTEEEALKAQLKRDTKLLGLLNACIKANHLVIDRNYCMKEEKKALEDMVIDINFDKVVVDRQVQEGSTYSDDIHQFLHAISNQEYAEQGKKPGFFIDPASQIALTENATHLLQHRYYKLEGATGTPGNKAERERYSKLFGINHIIKIPTHQERRTQFLPTEYCDSFDAQVATIAQQIIDHRTQPLLITCKDDAAVKKLHQGVCEYLIKHGHQDILEHIIRDTNDSGKSEADIVPHAGRNGKVTFSARLGRGTDIKPENLLLGLRVIRSYPSRPREAKQEYGRQGRNGVPGVCIDIINYAEVLAEVRALSYISLIRFEEIVTEEYQHLMQKLEKHHYLKESSLPKWHAFANEEYRNRYLITRTLEELKHEEKQEKLKYQQQKTNLMVTLSGAVFDKLYTLSATDPVRKKLWDDWLVCQTDMNTLWSRRLSGGKHDGPEVYEQFLMDVRQLWETIAKKFELNNSIESLLAQYSDHSNAVATTLDHAIKPREAGDRNSNLDQTTSIEAQTIYLNEVSHFNSELVRIAEEYLHQDPTITNTQRSFIYGSRNDPHGGLKALKQSLEDMSVKGYANEQLDHCSALRDIIIDSLSTTSSCKISFETYAQVIAHLSDRLEDVDYLLYLEGFRHFFTQPWLNQKTLAQESVDNLIRINLLLSLVTQIISTGFVDESNFDIDNEDPKSFTMITNLSEIIHQRFGTLDEDFSARIQSILAINKEVTQLLTRWSTDAISGKARLKRLIALINNSQYDEDQGVYRRTLLMQYLQTHCADLEAHDEAIAPVLELFFSAREEHLDALDLPPPLCLHSKELNIQYWNFLAKRDGIGHIDENGKKDWENLLDLFALYGDGLGSELDPANQSRDVVLESTQLETLLTLRSQDPYSESRPLEELRHAQKQENNMYERMKENLLVALGFGVLSTAPNRWSDWLACREMIETLWSDVDKRAISRESYSQFLAVATNKYTETFTFTAIIPNLEVLVEKYEGNLDVLKIIPSPAEAVSTPTVYAKVVDDFYKTFTEHMRTNLHSNDEEAVVNTQLQQYIEGDNQSDINDFKNELTRLFSQKAESNQAYQKQHLMLIGSIMHAAFTPAGPKISFKTYAGILQSLDRLKDAEDYPLFLEGFRHFFTQPWLGHPPLNIDSKANLSKINSLLPMIMKIVTTGFVTHRDALDYNPESRNILDIDNDDDSTDHDSNRTSPKTIDSEPSLDNENPATYDFIINLSEVMHNDFWNDDVFNQTLIDGIQCVLASDKKVTKLLTEWTADAPDGKAKLHRLIKLIHDTRNDTDKLKRLTKLNNYLKLHCDTLVSHHEALGPVIELFLTAREEHLDSISLPPPVCFDTPKLNADYWHFLVQQVQIVGNNKEPSITWENMRDLFTQYRNQETKLTQLVGHLTKVPAQVPLHYIHQRIVNKTEDVRNTTLHKITEAGEVWLKFVRKYDWLEANGEYSRPKESTAADFDHFLHCFEKMSPERNQELFAKITTFDRELLPQIKNLAYCYANHTDTKGNITSNELSVQCDFLNRINKLNDPVKATLLTKYNEVLQSNPRLLGEENGIFAALLVRIEQLKNSGLPGTAYDALINKWIDGIARDRYLTESELDQIVEVLKKAFALQQARTTTAWVETFQDIASKKRADRTAIMQHVLHGFVDLGAEFTTSCAREYRNLANTLIQNSNSNAPFKTRFQPILLLAREINSIATHPYLKTAVAPVEGRSERRTNNTLNTFFAENKENYAKTWRVNSKRRNQANTLFNSLENIAQRSSTTSKAAYYLALLDAVKDAQNLLLEGDRKDSPKRSLNPFGLLLRNIWRPSWMTPSTDDSTFGFQLNRKGHSRLYTITMELFAKVSEEYLKDAEIPLEARGALTPIIDAQLGFHITELKDRLPEGALKTRLSELTNPTFLANGSAGETNLSRVIAAIKKDKRSIPKTLLYLLTPIEAFDNLEHLAQENSPTPRRD